MKLFCIKCLMFTHIHTHTHTHQENNSTKLKLKIDGKINIYSRCNDCSFKKFPNIAEEELSDLLKKG